MFCPSPTGTGGKNGNRGGGQAGAGHPPWALADRQRHHGLPLGTRRLRRAREMSRFAGDSRVMGYLDSLAPSAEGWSPLRGGHHAGFYRFEAVEETGDLFGAAKVVGGGVVGVL